MLEKLTEEFGRHSALPAEQGEVLPKLKMFYEGQPHLRETLAPKARLEILGDDVVTLRSRRKNDGKAAGRIGTVKYISYYFVSIWRRRTWNTLHLAKPA